MLRSIVLSIVVWSLPAIVAAAILELKNNSPQLAVEADKTAHEHQPPKAPNQYSLEPAPIVEKKNENLKIKTGFSLIALEKSDTEAILPGVKNRPVKNSAAIQPDFFGPGEAFKPQVDPIRHSAMMISTLATEYDMEDLYYDVSSLLSDFNQNVHRLDDEIMFELYRRLPYMGWTEDRSAVNERSHEQQEAELMRELYGAAPVSEASSEPSGFMTAARAIHDFMTMSNLLILGVISMLGHGLFKVVRYFVLRM